jgi:hypothetical protein
MMSCRPSCDVSQYPHQLHFLYQAPNFQHLSVQPVTLHCAHGGVRQACYPYVRWHGLRTILQVRLIPISTEDIKFLYITFRRKSPLPASGYDVSSSKIRHLGLAAATTTAILTTRYQTSRGLRASNPAPGSSAPNGTVTYHHHQYLSARWKHD